MAAQVAWAGLEICLFSTRAQLKLWMTHIQLGQTFSAPYLMQPALVAPLNSIDRPTLMLFLSSLSHILSYPIEDLGGWLVFYRWIFCFMHHNPQLVIKLKMWSIASLSVSWQWQAQVHPMLFCYLDTHRWKGHHNRNLFFLPCLLFFPFHFSKADTSLCHYCHVFAIGRCLPPQSIIGQLWSLGRERERPPFADVCFQVG